VAPMLFKPRTPTLANDPMVIRPELLKIASKFKMARSVELSMLILPPVLLLNIPVPLLNIAEFPGLELLPKVICPLF
jgi:hypothetical protein